MPFKKSQPKLDYLSLLNMAVSLILFFAIVTPVSAKEVLAGSQNLGELITKLINNVGEAVDQNVSNKEVFKSDFGNWYNNTSNMLEGVLDNMGLVISDYADSDKEFDEQDEDLINDFSSLQQDLVELINTYPQLTEVLQIVEPHVLEFDDVFIDEFPSLDSFPGARNPMGQIFQYYQSVEANNPLETGSFFRIEFVRPEERRTIIKEQVYQQTTNGVKESVTKFKEKIKINDEVLIYYILLVDNEIVEVYKKPEDFTVFHGLPRQMRADNVNENYVRFVEEMIHLINLELVLAYNEQGLDIPINHPQIVLPPGYSHEIFEDNFTEILEDLSEDVS